MRKLSSIVAAILICAGCAPLPQTPGQTAAAPAPTPAQPVCHDFQTQVTVGGAPQQATGRACLEADGSWHVSQTIPGLPELGYVVPPPPAPPGAVSAGEPECRSFTLPVTVGGQPQQATNRVCRQPDGSWQVTQSTPGLPDQLYTLPAGPPAYPAYDFWPWEPWAFGIGGVVVFAHRFHHFHHFAHGPHTGAGGGGRHRL